jgi:hypothetical protein
MNVHDARFLLKELAANAELAKKLIVKEVNDGLTLPEDLKVEFENLIAEAERDISTAAVFFAKMQRMGISSKRFAALR